MQDQRGNSLNIDIQLLQAFLSRLVPRRLLRIPLALAKMLPINNDLDVPHRRGLDPLGHLRVDLLPVIRIGVADGVDPLNLPVSFLEVLVEQPEMADSRLGDIEISMPKGLAGRELSVRWRRGRRRTC